MISLSSCRYVQIYWRRWENLGANESPKQWFVVTRISEELKIGREDEEGLPFLQFAARDSCRHRRYLHAIILILLHKKGKTTGDFCFLKTNPQIALLCRIFDILVKKY